MLLNNLKTITQPNITNVEQALGSISSIGAVPRMLEMGIISTEYKDASDLSIPTNTQLSEFVSYRITPLDRAVQAMCRERLGIVRTLRELLADEPEDVRRRMVEDPEFAESMLQEKTS